PVQNQQPRQRAPHKEIIKEHNPNFPHRLAQAEIQERFFSGQPIEARNSGGALFKVVFSPGGQAQRLNIKKDTTQTGKWRFLGDGYCSRWEGEHEICYTVVQDKEIIKV